MQIVHGPAAPTDAPRVLLVVDRLTLAKRRWRGVAENGAEFGFDLTEPLRDGAVFYVEANACYAIRQRPEPVLEIALPAHDAEGGARTGWLLGNLHFPIEIADGVVRAPDDPAVRQMLEREHIAFQTRDAVFHPMKGAAHGHHH